MLLFNNPKAAFSSSEWSKMTDYHLIQVSAAKKEGCEGEGVLILHNGTIHYALIISAHNSLARSESHGVLVCLSCYNKTWWCK